MDNNLSHFHGLDDDIIRRDCMSSNEVLSLFHILDDDVFSMEISFDERLSTTLMDNFCSETNTFDDECESCVSESSEDSLDELSEIEIADVIFIDEEDYFSPKSRVDYKEEGSKQGESIFKGHRKYDLMHTLQLGIRCTLERITRETKRDIVSADFGSKANILLKFPQKSAHLYKLFEFKWEDYCPLVFRHLRELFNLDATEYMHSVCGNDVLKEISSPGKSGSVFYLSHDDRFMIKTMRKSEVKVLLRMLPSYYNHLRAHQNTILTKFFGVHAIKPSGGQKVYFVVMHTIFCLDMHIHRHFDLKGSSQGRSADKIDLDGNKVDVDEKTTLKDLDLNFEFYLEPSWRKALIEQIEQDCKLLADENIMDYSLLLGVHIQSLQPDTVIASTWSIQDENNSNDMKQDSAEAKHYNSVRDTTIKSRASMRLGTNMPARAVPKQTTNTRQGLQQPVEYDVVLYFAIIDILQGYDMSKKLEHIYKSFQFDAFTFSAVDPKGYSRRFQEFMSKIFPS